MRRLRAMLALRCPRCLEGPVWRGVFTMHERCPRCDLRFEREPGYFTGAMVVSYALAVPALGVLVGIVLALTRWDLLWVLLSAEALFLLLVPVIFRYSRVLWMYFDWSVDPGERAKR